MARVRQTTVEDAHRSLGRIATEWPEVTQEGRLLAYALHEAATHILSTGDVAGLCALFADAGYLVTRLRHRPEVHKLVRDYRALAELAPDVPAISDWSRLIGERKHVLVRCGPGLEPWRNLLQVAVEDADTSAATRAAEALLDGGDLAWPRLRCVSRPARPPVSRCRAVYEGHRGPVLGAQTGATWTLTWTEDEVRGWRQDTGELVWTAATAGRPLLVRSEGDIVLVVTGVTLSWLSLETGSTLDRTRIEGGPLEGATSTSNRTICWSSDAAWTLGSDRCLRRLKGPGHADDEPPVCGDELITWAEDRLFIRARDGSVRQRIRTPHERVSGAVTLGTGRVVSWGSWDSSPVVAWRYGRLQARYEGHSSHRSGAVGAGGDRVVSWGADHDLHLWSFTTGEAIARLSGHGRGPEGVLILGDGTLLSWGGDGTIRRWRATDGALLATFEGVSRYLQGVVRVTSDRLLSWAWGGLVELWSLAEGGSIGVLEGHTGHVGGLSTSDRAVAVSWSEDSTARVWSYDGAPDPRAPGHRTRVAGVAERRDGRFLTWDNDSWWMWDPATGAGCPCPCGHEGAVFGASMLHDDTVLSWAGDGEIRIWDPQDGRTLVRMERHNDEALGAIPLSDGTILSWSVDGTLLQWELPPPGSTHARRLLSLEGHDNWIKGARELADGRILTWAGDKTARCWTLEQGRVRAVQILEGHTNYVEGAALLADGRFLSWGGGVDLPSSPLDPTLRLWGPDGKPGPVLKGHRSCVRAAVQLDGDRLASVDEDGEFRLWSIEQRRALLNLPWDELHTQDQALCEEWLDRTAPACATKDRLFTQVSGAVVSWRRGNGERSWWHGEGRPHVWAHSQRAGTVAVSQGRKVLFLRLVDADLDPNS